MYVPLQKLIGFPFPSLLRQYIKQPMTMLSHCFPFVCLYGLLQVLGLRRCLSYASKDAKSKINIQVTTDVHASDLHQAISNQHEH